MDDPSTNGGNGRDPRTGRFAKGNSGGPGNPNAQHVAKLRDGFRSACTLADVRAICRRLVAMAKKGNVLAAREVLDRTIGKSVTALEQSGADSTGSIMPVFEMPPVGAEQSQDFGDKSTSSVPDDAFSDSRLLKLIEVWPALSDDVRDAIRALAETETQTSSENVCPVLAQRAGAGESAG